MSWAANFVAALQNTFNSHGFSPWARQKQTSQSKGDRKSVSKRHKGQKRRSKPKKNESQQPRWIKRAKPIEEWLLSFWKHARKTYTASKDGDFISAFFSFVFPSSHWRLWYYYCYYYYLIFKRWRSADVCARCCFYTRALSLSLLQRAHRKWTTREVKRIKKPTTTLPNRLQTRTTTPVWKTATK